MPQAYFTTCVPPPNLNGNSNFSLSFSTSFDWSDLPQSFNTTGFIASVRPFSVVPLANRSYVLELLPAVWTSMTFFYDSDTSPDNNTGVMASITSSFNGTGSRLLPWIILVSSSDGRGRTPRASISFSVPPAALRLGAPESVAVVLKPTNYSAYFVPSNTDLDLRLPSGCMPISSPLVSAGWASVE